MNTQDVGFFILSDDDLISTPEYAVIRIDHEVMVSVMYDMYHTFGPNEKEFFNWYKDEYLLKKSAYR